MGSVTGIQWCDHTMNFWWGCGEVTPGCDHCYARVLMTAWGRDFDTVQRTSRATWTKASAWERQAIGDGRPHRVFTCSMGDFFHPAADAWRDEAWAVIKATPHLTWQILTKRANRIAGHLPADWGADGYPHVWLGTSVESAPEWWRAARFLSAVPAVIRFISYEPAIGPLFATRPGETWTFPHPRTGKPVTVPLVAPEALTAAGVDWLIVGGESGSAKDARPLDLAWAREAVRVCQAHGVAVFVKQLGSVWARATRTHRQDGHGGNAELWPEDLRVREFPAGRASPAHAPSEKA
jgi:protein gp37